MHQILEISFDLYLKIYCKFLIFTYNGSLNWAMGKVWDYIMANKPDDDPHYKPNETFCEYIENRFRPQRDYFKKRARQSMRLYHIFQILIIVISAIIPLVNLSLPTDNHDLRIISSLLGISIVISTGILQLSKAQENWMLFTSTLDSLENEYYLFSHHATPYSKDSDTEKNEASFVERVENIISAKGKKYVSNLQRNVPSPGNNQDKENKM